MRTRRIIISGGKMQHDLQRENVFWGKAALLASASLLAAMASRRALRIMTGCTGWTSLDGSR
jgi:hypothetical protein